MRVAGDFPTRETTFRTGWGDLDERPSKKADSKEANKSLLSRAFTEITLQTAGGKVRKIEKKYREAIRGRGKVAFAWGGFRPGGVNLALEGGLTPPTNPLRKEPV